jgi:hypothetical protein
MEDSHRFNTRPQVHTTLDPGAGYIEFEPQTLNLKQVVAEALAPESEVRG